MSLQSATERLSAPLDWCRRGWFRLLVQSAFVRATLAHRDRRIATIACGSVLGAALGAVYFPVLMFTLGPVFLGVAHVASDVRYLVLRRKLARWWLNVVWAGCLLLILLRALEELKIVRHAERVEFGAAATFVAVALCAGLSERGSRPRAALACAALALATAFAWSDPKMARYVFLHAHNVIALLAWATLFRANKRWLLAPALLIVVVAVALGSGAFFAQTIASPFAASFHLHVLTVSDWVAPLSNARLAVGITTAYLFLQSVHYSAWLSWIPQEEQLSRGTPTFRMSVRSLFADFGAPGVAAVALAAAAVLFAACFDVQRARALYLSLATFHGYLELALLGFFWVRGGVGTETQTSRPAALHAEISAAVLG